MNGWVAAAIVVLTALDLHTYAQLSRRVRALEGRLGDAPDYMYRAKEDE